jgi:formamidopyrimidine-DNA glycosylase
MPEGPVIRFLSEKAQVFAGVGNKIEDEILFNAKGHPASNIEKVPEKKKMRIHAHQNNLSR